MRITILHATDLSENHFKMCERAVDIAKQLNAKLYLLHVIETPPSMVLAQGLGFVEIERPEPLVLDAKSVMGVLGETLAIPKNQLLVELGSAKVHILQKATDLACQMIIIGHHSDSKSAFLGNTARGVVDEALCDVLTLRE
ncbi:MAG: universal stress protein [Legionellaceae bacterium]|nr:universal stress protein [Legionellaceae bacterium]MBP9775573.1 universal stress protein [Legionellaceae bacterium]